MRAPHPRVRDINSEVMGTVLLSLAGALSSFERPLARRCPPDSNLGREVVKYYGVSFCTLALWQSAFPAPAFVRRDPSACQYLQGHRRGSAPAQEEKGTREETHLPCGSQACVGLRTTGGLVKAACCTHMPRPCDSAGLRWDGTPAFLTSSVNHTFRTPYIRLYIEIYRISFRYWSSL